VLPVLVTITALIASALMVLAMLIE